jgi:hypothetical protein
VLELSAPLALSDARSRVPSDDEQAAAWGEGASIDRGHFVKAPGSRWVAEQDQHGLGPLLLAALSRCPSADARCRDDANERVTERRANCLLDERPADLTVRLDIDRHTVHDDAVRPLRR